MFVVLVSKPGQALVASDDWMAGLVIGEILVITQCDVLLLAP